MGQLALAEHLVCLPFLSLEAAGDIPPDLSIYLSSSFEPDLFKDVDVVAEAPLVAIDIMDGQRTMNEALQRAQQLELAGVRSSWIVEPVSHSVLVLEDGAGKRRLYHAEKVERAGVVVDFARIFGHGEALEAPLEMFGDRRLVDALRVGEHRIFLPSVGAQGWKQLFADPEKHWKPGMPTRALAHCWESGEGMPSEVRRVLDDDPETRNARPLFVVPEYQVSLPGGSRPAHNDIWLLAEGSGGLISISVDGKGRESFGISVKEWFAGKPAGKEKRLRYICEQLEIPFPPPDELKYSLLQRATSAVIEARRFKAPLAVLMIHSFSSSDQGMEHFNNLLSVMGLKARGGELVSRKLSDGSRIGFAWARGERRFLDA